MSESVFGGMYANHYDLLYHDKDYEMECDLLEKIFQQHADGEVHTILDMGCGTGSHAIPLARRGYTLVGVDRAPEMLSHARRKLQAINSVEQYPAPTFVQGDVRTFDQHQSFDAVIMMFAVLSYQLTNEDVSATLQTVRRHLRPGGLFIADIWYGPTVLGYGPSDRVKIVKLENGQLIRTASSTLEVRRHTCVVHYNMWHLEGQRLVSHDQEDHAMRFFFPMELEHYLNRAQLEMIGLYPFPNWTDPIAEDTWNVLLCGRATT